MNMPRALPLAVLACSAAFSGCETGYAACVMPVAGAEGRSTSMDTGLRNISLDRSAIVGGIVALKNIV